MEYLILRRMDSSSSSTSSREEMCIRDSGHTERKYKGSDLLINTKLLCGRLHVKRKSSRTGGSGESEYCYTEDLLCELHRILLCCSCYKDRVSYEEE